jgi:hypothetical protein
MKVTKLSDKVGNEGNTYRHNTLFIELLHIIQVFKFSVNVTSFPEHGKRKFISESFLTILGPVVIILWGKPFFFTF